MSRWLCVWPTEISLPHRITVLSSIVPSPSGTFFIASIK